MSRPSNELNLEHYLNPQAGDVWAEMMCVYHIVLDVTENDRLIIAEKDLTVKEGQSFDFVNAKEITQDEHRKLITYSGNVDLSKGATFVADVIVGNAIAINIIKKWKEEYKGNYITYEERQERLSKEKKQDEELGTGLGFLNTKLQGGLVKSTMTAVNSFNINSRYTQCGYRIVKSMRDIEENKTIEAIAQFEYKGYQIAFSTIKQTSDEVSRLVSVWSGEKRDNFINSVETVEEAIKFVDRQIDQFS